MIDTVALGEVLDQLRKTEANANSLHVRLCALMCRAMDLISNCLPEAAGPAMRTAQDHWLRGQNLSEQLDAARVTMWSFLDAKGHGSEIRDKEDAAVRALLCTLYPSSPDGDFSVDTVRWQVECLNRIGDYAASYDRLLRQVRPA